MPVEGLGIPADSSLLVILQFLHTTEQRTYP